MQRENLLVEQKGKVKESEADLPDGTPSLDMSLTPLFKPYEEEKEHAVTAEPPSVNQLVHLWLITLCYQGNLHSNIEKDLSVVLLSIVCSFSWRLSLCQTYSH